MDQFDKVLEDYRKALSPCGQVACAYTSNIAEETCTKTCNINLEDLQVPPSGHYNACGSPECPYARYKSSLMPMDEDVEAQFIGPAIVGTCGHPKCSYRADPILPPIHWECPEPLPADGKCKNPNCPYPKAGMSKNERFSSSRGPCGSDMCPFALPAPCPVSTCPFKALPPCTHMKLKNLEKSDPNCACEGKEEDDSKKKEKTKPRSKCPFDNPPQIVNMMFCDNPNCENRPSDPLPTDKSCAERTEACRNPDCPYGQKKLSYGFNINVCANPDCPRRNYKMRMATECQNPECLKKKSDCTNPECPYKKFKKHMSETDPSECTNPECPSRRFKQFFGSTGGGSGDDCRELECDKPEETCDDNLNKCSNPECPYKKSSKESAEEEKESACLNPDCPFNKPSLEACQNPDCPFRNLSQMGSLEESLGSCDNPECPYKRGSQGSQESECECDNPSCPSKRETCLNPSCPFNLRGCEDCTNPDCPNRRFAIEKNMFVCVTPGDSFNEFCADKTCPFHDPKDDVAQEARRLTHLEGPRGKSLVQIGDMTIEKGSIVHISRRRASVYDMAPCTLRTCQYMGGMLKCADCGVGTEGHRSGPCPKTCPGEPICAFATARNLKKYPKRVHPKSKRTCRGLFKARQIAKGISETGEKVEDYPGYKLGHRECVVPYFYVPPRMGWLWNIHTPCLNLAPRRGWRPGAICRKVARLIARHKRERENSGPQEKRKTRRRNRDSYGNELICPKPTLEVKKREGIYHIKMNPLKDPEVVQMNENPYLDCTPLQFQVCKKNRAEPDIVCGDEGEYYKDDSSSDDELDIEVTTPAGIIHPDRPTQKPELKTEETQYNVNDSKIKEVVDKKNDKKPDSKKGKDKGKKKAGTADKGGKKKK